MYSPCEHGPTSTLVSHLKPLLEQYGAHYMAGHDHCISHIKEQNSNVHYINSGMGIECCYKASNKNKIPAGSAMYILSKETQPDGVHGGFASVDISTKEMVVTYYDQV